MLFEVERSGDSGRSISDDETDLLSGWFDSGNSDMSEFSHTSAVS